MSGIARSLYGVARAAVRLLDCALVGHDYDRSIPSPAGLVYCRRCHARYPEAQP
jgi:hypothetical protein